VKYHFIFFALTALLFIAPASSSTLTYADYAALPEKSMVTVSPSGKNLAYRETTNGRDRLIVIDLNTSSIIRAVDIAAVNPDNIHFIDNKNLILKVSKNSWRFGYKGRHDVSVAYSFNLDSGKIYQLLTAGHGVYEGQNSLGRIIGLSPDHKYAYMPAWKNLSSYALYKVNLTKKRAPRVYQSGTSDAIDYFVDAKGNVLARERYNNETNIHQLEALQDDDWVVIYQEEAEIMHVSFSGVTPDSKSLLMSRHDDENGRWAYHTISLKDGAISEAIFSREDRDVENVLTDVNRVVYGVRYSGFKPSYEFFDKKLNARIDAINKAMPEYTLRIEDYTPDWSSIIFHMDGGGSSGQFIRYHEGKLELLTNARPNITSEFVNEVQEISYKARDGLTIPTLLTLPKVKEIKNLPTIVLPHGGPESYDKIKFDWLPQYFASQGYLVIQPQFRGSEGFGTAHKQKGRGEWGRKMQDDLTDAVNMLVKEGKTDPKRVCIVGWSYGGYAALAGATFTPELYKCVVSINGVSDIPQMLKNDRSKYGEDHWVVSYWDRVIASGKLEEGHLEKISPINSVKKITAPVLLIHGENDLVVSFDQSDDMFNAMKEANKDVTFVEIEGGNHSLTNAKNRAKALESVDKFLKKHI